MHQEQCRPTFGWAFGGVRTAGGGTWPPGSKKRLSRRWKRTLFRLLEARGLVCPRGVSCAEAPLPCCDDSCPFGVMPTPDEWPFAGALLSVDCPCACCTPSSAPTIDTGGAGCSFTPATACEPLASGEEPSAAAPAASACSSGPSPLVCASCCCSFFVRFRLTLLPDPLPFACGGCSGPPPSARTAVSAAWLSARLLGDASALASPASRPSATRGAAAGTDGGDGCVAADSGGCDTFCRLRLAMSRSLLTLYSSSRFLARVLASAPAYARRSSLNTSQCFSCLPQHQPTPCVANLQIRSTKRMSHPSQKAASQRRPRLAVVNRARQLLCPP